MASCAQHQFDEASGTCSSCGAPFCAECLIYPFGDRKPPLCVPCALVAGGIRRKRIAS